MEEKPLKPLSSCCAQVAQSVEQGTENPRVSSSILFLGTTHKIKVAGA